MFRIMTCLEKCLQSYIHTTSIHRKPISSELMCHNGFIAGDCRSWAARPVIYIYVTTKPFNVQSKRIVFRGCNAHQSRESILFFLLFWQQLFRTNDKYTRASSNASKGRLIFCFLLLFGRFPVTSMRVQTSHPFNNVLPLQDSLKKWVWVFGVRWCYTSIRNDIMSKSLKRCGFYSWKNQKNSLR